MHKSYYPYCVKLLFSYTTSVLLKYYLFRSRVFSCCSSLLSCENGVDVCSETMNLVSSVHERGLFTITEAVFTTILSTFTERVVEQSFGANAGIVVAAPQYYMLYIMSGFSFIDL